MASSLLFLSGAGAGTIGGALSFTAYGGLGNAGPGYSNQTSEAPFQHQCAAAGTLSNLYVNVTTNTRNGTTVYTVRRNTTSPASGLTVTHGAGVTGVQTDTTNNVTIAVDDLLNSQIVCNGSSGNYGPAGIGMRFDPTGSTAVPYIGSTTGTGIAYTGTSTNVYAPIAGRLNTAPAAEDDTRTNIPFAGTAKYLQMYCGTNGRSSSTVVTLRINKASVNQTKTFTAGTTGLLVDTSNTDAVAAADLLDIQIALGTGTGNFTVLSDGVWVASTTEGQAGTASGDTGTISFAAGATSYNTLGGRFGVSTTESLVQQEPGTAATGSKLWVNVVSNASSTNAATVFRNGASTGNQSVTLTASTTGPFQDTTHSDSFATTDLINAQTSNVTTGAITVSVMSMMLTTVVTSPASGATLCMMGIG